MMNKGANLPDDHHVMRFVPWNRLLRDDVDNVIGFLPQAFALRPGEESLSVNWLEYFGGDRITNIRDSVLKFRGTYKVGKKSAFGIANVKKIGDTCSATAGVKVRVVYEPSRKNPAHSGIRRLPRDDLTLLDALAVDAFSELVKNSDVKSI
jgi:hypothetical protein